jgi:glycosyltransferase involved in cell wall biosynthesis
VNAAPADETFDLSVIIPVKNEEGSIPILSRELEEVLGSAGWRWECLWVDDGSTDRTLELLKELHDSHPHHHYLSLDANYGQSAALAMGFKRASGRVIATLDGDLQNDPHDILLLMAELSPGKADMVNGVRAKRHDSLVRKISSRIGNGFRNWLTGEKVTDVGCSLRVFYRECVEDIPVWKGMHRFIPTLVKLRGFHAIEKPVNHRPRTYGQTKYAIGNRLWVGLWDTMAVRWMQKRFVQGKIAVSSKEKD